ncbi:MAG: alpha/beta fold hydrolase, partial [Candidatus Dadabacteria bacterium]
MQLPRWLKEQLPYKSRFIEIDGYNMHYLDEGRGPVVLLLHGNPTWCFYYRHLIRLLSRDFRVIAPDYIGCGLSDRTPGKAFRATDRIRQVSELIDALGIERFSLVMHDWGGSIGTSVAVERPEKIDKLVYLNTTLTETEALPLVIRLAANRITGKFLTKYTKKFVKLTTKLGVCSKLPREVRDAYLYPYRKISERSAIWDFVADIPFDQDHPSYAAMLELAEKLPRLSHVPVKIVWGLRDPCFHREMLGKVARHFPQADILEIPDASHLVLEDASEEANQAIYEFLSDETIEVKDVTPGVQGGEVTSAEVSEHVLFKRLREQAREHPFRPAVVEPLYLADSIRYRHVSYQAFYDLTNKYQRGLTALGLERGDRVLMLVSPGEDFLALSYAVMGRGAIPFFVDPGMGRENLFRTIEEIDPQILIGSPKAHLLRILKKKLFSRLKFHITASTWIYTGGPNLSYLKKFAPQPLPAVSAPEVALVAYTSGATGAPKGVIYTGAMLAEQLRIFSDVFKLQAGNKDLPLLPVFSLFNLAAGVCSVFPPLDPARPLSFDPEKIVKIVNELGINYSFGSPTLWTKISEYCVRSRETLPSLERVFIAGAAVSADTLKLVKSIVPAGEVFTPYGATEALPVTLVSAVEITGLDPESAA